MALKEMILPILSSALKLTVNIIEIVKKKGIDGAGKMRLEDIPGWQEWSQETLKAEAVAHFIEQLDEFKKKAREQ